MYYSIRHVTSFTYSSPIRESVQEVRMQPRSEGPQRCLTFKLLTEPRATVASYVDSLGNRVHHFDIPDQHSALTITAQAVVEMGAVSPLPEALAAEAWTQLDALTADGAYWDYLQPSVYARPTALLSELATTLAIVRRSDPLTVLRELNTSLYTYFSYVPQSTTAKSPIDDALRTRAGVCQDFAHVMIALCRELQVPARYVSGYLAPREARPDRSSADATHAWVEALLPGRGWVGFDPTNDQLTAERHVRVAVGRDYADVPPNRGVFNYNKGSADQDLSVAVHVVPSETLPTQAAWSSPIL